LVEHYAPHGFPPYLGLGLLDPSSLRLHPGESVAEYKAGAELVYRVRGTYDAATNPGVSTACAAANASWEIEEYFAGRPWRKTGRHKTLSQVFFHHLAEQLPIENPRVGALLRRLTEEYGVAVRCRNSCTYVMFPAGYLYAIRVPLTDDTLEGFKAFVAADPDALPVPWPKASNPMSVAIIKTDRAFRTEFQRGVACDVTVASIRLTQTLERLRESNAVAGEVHLRPEVIYAHELHRRFSQVHPGRLRDGVVTYQVVPIDDDTPPPGELATAFIGDSLEVYSLVAEALQENAGPGDDPRERGPHEQ